MSTETATPSLKPSSAGGMRKNGKQWHVTKKAFRPAAGQTSYAKRVAREAQAAEVKKIGKEMKGEKEEERQVSLGQWFCLRGIFGAWRDDWPDG